MIMFDTRIYAPSGFRFSPQRADYVHSDKLRGLVKFGPYQTINKAPRIGFVFPERYREYGNKLYLALHNGIGYFKGLSTLLKVPFEKSQVFPVTGFSLPNPHDHEDSAMRYRDAILAWKAKESDTADLFVNLHPKSLAWEEDSAYGACKAVLLEAGISSQNVTFELMDNASQFEWAAANIALGIFVKLGGIPWVANLEVPNQYIIVGMGRTEKQDPVTRRRTQFTSFTTCVRDNGIYELTHFGKPCATREEHLIELKKTAAVAFKKALDLGPKIKGIVIHFPKEFARDERFQVEEARDESSRDRSFVSQTLRISEEERFFAFDDSANGIPPRGTCIKLRESEHILYTEGAEEKAAWSNRLPTAVRVRHFDTADKVVTNELLSQVFDLSLVNYRGFNAKAFPISLYYSHLIAKILARGTGLSLSEEVLGQRMWFL
jgi:argonaute-like protein implicated in RNA metabolism and viral defense